MNEKLKGWLYMLAAMEALVLLCAIPIWADMKNTAEAADTAIPSFWEPFGLVNGVFILIVIACFAFYRGMDALD